MAASGAFSIKLFLADGTPDGLRIVEKSKLDGSRAGLYPEQYPNVRTRKEFQGAGAYVLLGPGETILPRVYVGEAEVLRKRLDNHHQNNEFWTRFVAFTSRAGNLNKAHVRYLEARLIALANAAKRAEIANGTAPPNPSLSEAETADVESFLRDMLLIFPLLEVNAFQLTAASPLPASNNVTPAAVDALLYLKGPSAEATGLDTPEGFIVKAGSKARAASVPSIHKWLVDLRDTLLAQGILSAQGEQLVLTQDYAFDSPSSAAGALLGRAANGRVEWKAEDGKTLKELQVASITADPSEKTTAHPDREAQRSQSGCSSNALSENTIAATGSAGSL